MKRSIYLLSIATVCLTGIIIYMASKPCARQLVEKKETPGYDYFYAQRAFPYWKIDYTAQQKASESFKKHLQEMRSSSFAAWQYAGPNNIGGRIVDIEMDPTNQNIAYLAAASGGVFKTSNGGIDWLPIFDNETTLSIGDIAIAPSNPNIIYVGTGEANGGSGSLTYDANGIYKSTDAGQTWANVGLQTTRMTGRMAVHPTNPDIEFAATMGDIYGSTPDRGLYKTSDGGLTWTQVLFLTDSTGCIDVVINPQNPNYVYAAMWERSRKPNDKRYFGVSSGLWRSTDGGNTWAQLTNGLPPVGTLLSRIGIDLCDSSPNVVYAKFIDSNYGFYGLYKSVNDGTSWTQTNDAAIFNNSNAPQAYWYGRIKVDPADPNIVYDIGFDMYKTTDGGNNWQTTFDFVHVDQHAIAIHPLNHNFVMNGNDGGLHISNDGGINWTHHTDLPITQFYTCEMDYNDPNVLVGGTQDNNTIRTLTGSFYDWESLVGGDGFYALIDPVDNTFWYAEYQYGNMFRSDDGGFSFFPIDVGLTGSGNWNTPLVFDPQNSLTLFTGYQQVFRTDDQGNNWFSISPNLTTIDPSGSLLFGTITTIAISPLNSDIIYAGTDDGKVWNTLNGGMNWNLISTGLPVRWVTRITCDPFNQNRAYVTLSGYRYHDNMSHIYMTDNDGNTWQNIAGNLPDVPCNDVVADPAVDSVLYIATDAGTYYTTDAGQAWGPLGTGIPVLVFTDLKIHAPTRTLLAATYGRGMYKLDLNLVVNIDKTEIVFNSVNIYPVPAKDHLTIEFNCPVNSGATFAVYDLKGKHIDDIYTSPSANGQTVLRWNIPERVTSGVYFLAITINGKKEVKKFVVQ